MPSRLEPDHCTELVRALTRARVVVDALIRLVRRLFVLTFTLLVAAGMVIAHLRALG